MAGKRKTLPEEYALQSCQGWGITRIIDAVELLVRRGAPVVERALENPAPAVLPAVKYRR